MFMVAILAAYNFSVVSYKRVSKRNDKRHGKTWPWVSNSMRSMRQSGSVDRNGIGGRQSGGGRHCFVLPLNQPSID